MEGKGRAEAQSPSTELTGEPWHQRTPGPPTQQQFLRPQRPLMLRPGWHLPTARTQGALIKSEWARLSDVSGAQVTA